MTKLSRRLARGQVQQPNKKTVRSISRSFSLTLSTVSKTPLIPTTTTPPPAAPPRAHPTLSGDPRACGVHPPAPPPVRPSASASSSSSSPASSSSPPPIPPSIPTPPLAPRNARASASANQQGRDGRRGVVPANQSSPPIEESSGRGGVGGKDSSQVPLGGSGGGVSPHPHPSPPVTGSSSASSSPSLSARMSSPAFMRKNRRKNSASSPSAGIEPVYEDLEGRMDGMDGGDKVGGME